MVKASTKTQTFDSARAALANARKLKDSGQISATDYARLEKKLIADLRAAGRSKGSAE